MSENRRIVRFVFGWALAVVIWIGLYYGWQYYRLRTKPLDRNLWWLSDNIPCKDSDLAKFDFSRYGNVRAMGEDSEFTLYGYGPGESFRYFPHKSGPDANVTGQFFPQPRYFWGQEPKNNSIVEVIDLVCFPGGEVWWQTLTVYGTNYDRYFYWVRDSDISNVFEF